MDIKEQQETYDGFMRWTKYGLIGVIAILLVLAAIA
ncbi:aa3-type cytochrome c oxidase subunit IV [Temperatibacter marinus]|uniref:Aa3-type cytochrome c oxidase subunit IV n=1 Tax=Temperatibacter marinus TaxID=1456591 RepID=A0AA52EGN2_9PROT|nr:aa3-type cytochrome c oxidase subunit IV [Temperatibacter marinus]WND02440.1 aa3-type cytochrome c oxidase subunit IV [Temperatibacter marinus]